MKIAWILLALVGLGAASCAKVATSGSADTIRFATALVSVRK
jgi:hypothetical protein